MAFKAAKNLFRDFVRLQNRIKSYVLQEQENLRNIWKLDRNGLDVLDGCHNAAVRPSYEKVQRKHQQISLYHYIKNFSRFFFPLNHHSFIIGNSWQTHFNRTSLLFGAIGLAYYGSPDCPQSSKLSMNDVLVCLNMVGKIEAKRQDEVAEPWTKPDSITEFKLKERLGEPSSCAAVYAAEYHDKEYAIKVMFNYEYASNEHAILKGFSRECCVLYGTEGKQDFGQSHQCTLPDHPNIIKGLGTYVIETPCLHDAIESYPSALPKHVHPNGFGRNKTLCLVMPKYDCTLRNYLIHFNATLEEKMLIFAQLLDGVAHLVENFEAHRDLKSDNILLETKEGVCPKLVITDFGCCLGERDLQLKLPFESDHIDRGGNSALMAPEIAAAFPSPGGFLDYSKADLWACGAIGLEMFGQYNPFTCGILQSRTYKEEEIQIFCDELPMSRRIITALLRRDPDERPSATEAALMPLLILLAPKTWLEYETEVCEKDVNTWLVVMWLKQLRDERSCSFQGVPFPTDLVVKRRFLERATAVDILSALTFLRQ